jgi:hypothetical protein
MIWLKSGPVRWKNIYIRGAGRQKKSKLTQREIWFMRILPLSLWFCDEISLGCHILEYLDPLHWQFPLPGAVQLNE